MPHVLQKNAWLLLCSAVFACAVRADDHVVVVANANADYTERKFSGGSPARETFVLMQGRHYPGLTADSSLRNMSFRQMVSFLLPKLAEQQYFPAKSVATADLLLVVHWGVTSPRVGRLELMAQTERNSIAHELAREPRHPDLPEDPLTPLLGAQDRYDEVQRINDSITDARSDRNLAQLLGYARALNQAERATGISAEEDTLRHDLRSERYFIIVRAHDLRTRQSRPRPVWALHINTSSPGNNFRTAMIRMSAVAPQFVGRTTETVATLRVKAPEFTVELGDLIILGEAEADEIR